MIYEQAIAADIPRTRPRPLSNSHIGSLVGRSADCGHSPLHVLEEPGLAVEVLAGESQVVAELRSDSIAMPPHDRFRGPSRTT